MIEYWKNKSLESLFYIDENGIIQQEEWRDIPNYVGRYQLSTLSRVKSLERFCKHAYGGNKKVKEKILAQSVSYDKYLAIRLVNQNGGKTFNIHSLMAIVFLGHIPCGHYLEADHKNNNPFDNRLENIQIITHRINSTKDKKKSSSEYTNVFYREKYNTWRSCIKVKTKAIEIGAFKDEHVAGKASLLALENIDKYDGDNAKFRSLIKSLLRI